MKISSRKLRAHAFFACALIGSSAFADGTQDSVVPQSLVCESPESYNQTIIVNLTNQLAELQGTELTDYPDDCWETDDSLNRPGFVGG